MKSISLFILAGLLCLSFGPSALAQSADPELILTWQSNSYIPANYQGKALVTKNSAISASLTVLDKNKVADLSQTEVRWFLDDHLIQSGLGLTAVKFSASRSFSSTMELEVEIHLYKGKTSTQSVFIPKTEPKAVLDLSFLGTVLNLEALPYFFDVQNIQELIFNWSVNNLLTESVGIEGSSASLNANIGEIGDEIILKLGIQKLIDTQEAGETETIYIIK